MAEFPDALIEQAAKAIYDASPARQPWDGDTFGWHSTHWAAADKQKAARKKARAVLEAVAPAIEANALRAAGREWAEGAWQDAYASFPVEDDVSSVQAADRWLNERADQINPKEDTDA